MAALFTDEARMDRWLEVEQAALAALTAAGIAPASACEALAAVHSVDVNAVRAREAEIHHDLAAFVDVVGAAAPASASWLHYGLTSSDVVDTALAMQLSAAIRLILDGIEHAMEAVLERAHEHRDTVMLGRTHGMPAEVITFGAKLVGWWHTLQRDHERISSARESVAVGKLSGAVGLYTGVSPSVEAHVMSVLDLGVDVSATQVVQRDRHAQLLAALATCASNLDRFALEMRHLQRADVGEAAEPFGISQKGSSAMPHKRNPIVAERICGLARVVRAYAQVGFDNVALWHERDISHSSAERIVIPDALLAVDYMLDRFEWLVRGMRVDTARMRQNVERERGLVCSQRVLLALVESGMPRDDAYRCVQAAALEVHEGRAASLKDALVADATAISVLSMDQLHAVCDPFIVPAGVAHVFDRVPSRAKSAPAG
jgi:adenylosuccinate lyase